MNRAERRRAEREARKKGYTQGRQINAVKHTDVFRDPDRMDAARQDFLAGTIFAAGAGVIIDDTPDSDMPPIFLVFLDDSAYSVCPRLRDYFARLDTGGVAALGEVMTVAASWAIMGRSDGVALAKLKLDFLAPVKTRAEIILLAENYADVWQHIADGGLIGLTTLDRIRDADLHGEGGYGRALNQCIPIQMAASPGIRQLIGMYGWPTNNPPVPNQIPVTGAGAEHADDVTCWLATTASPHA
ncbi:MAG: hypothetical protein H0T78_11970, partial [Longispora sp.]|nr:hypothetical protein [Longispora sp. (in: high G+C Gram-positive bacteria)]